MTKHIVAIKRVLRIGVPCVLAAGLLPTAFGSDIGIEVGNATIESVRGYPLPGTFRTGDKGRVYLPVGGAQIKIRNGNVRVAHSSEDPVAWYEGRIKQYKTLRDIAEELYSDKADYFTYLMLGHYYKQRNQSAAAKAAYAESIRRNPTFPLAYHDHASVSPSTKAEDEKRAWLANLGVLNTFRLKLPKPPSTDIDLSDMNPYPEIPRELRFSGGGGSAGGNEDTAFFRRYLGPDFNATDIRAARAQRRLNGADTREKTLAALSVFVTMMDADSNAAMHGIVRSLKKLGENWEKQ